MLESKYASLAGFARQRDAPTHRYPASMVAFVLALLALSAPAAALAPGSTVTVIGASGNVGKLVACLLYTSPSPRDGLLSRMPSSA